MREPAGIALLLLACGPIPGGAQVAPPGRGGGDGGSVAPRTVIVRMVERGPYGIAFEPIRVTVELGDTVRFLQAGHLVHNVEFRSVPAGVDLGSARLGPDLVAAGQTYDVPIDARFPPGKYVYVCTPHEVLGMAGIIYVVPRDPGR